MKVIHLQKEKYWWSHLAGKNNMGLKELSRCGTCLTMNRTQVQIMAPYGNTAESGGNLSAVVSPPPCVCVFLCLSEWQKQHKSGEITHAYDPGIAKKKKRKSEGGKKRQAVAHPVEPTYDNAQRTRFKDLVPMCRREETSWVVRQCCRCLSLFPSIFPPLSVSMSLSNR